MSRKIIEPEEQWKPLVFDYLDKKNPRYYVSTQGRFKAYTHISKGTIIKGSEILGYSAICVSIREKNKPKIRKYFFMRRLIAEAFIPNLEKKKNVICLDYNKANILPNNLAWATSEEQSAHSKKNPRFANEKYTVYNSRLNKAAIALLRILLNLVSLT